MAKDLVRTRRYVKKFILMKANLQAVSLKIQVAMSVFEFCFICRYVNSKIGMFHLVEELILLQL